MIDESCEVPREDLDEGFNPCRRQVAENGELRQYAHMYDVMNERYDREEDTSYINSVKRDKINPNTHTSIASGNNVALYSQNRVNKSEGVLGSGSLNLDKRDDSVMTSKAVADYVAASIPDLAELEAELNGKLDKVTAGTTYTQLYAVTPDGAQGMKAVTTNPANIISNNPDVVTAGAVADYVPTPSPREAPAATRPM